MHSKQPRNGNQGCDPYWVKVIFIETLKSLCLIPLVPLFSAPPTCVVQVLVKQIRRKEFFSSFHIVPPMIKLSCSTPHQASPRRLFHTQFCTSVSLYINHLFTLFVTFLHNLQLLNFHVTQAHVFFCSSCAFQTFFIHQLMIADREFIFTSNCTW